jgi:hypothetical protein
MQHLADSCANCAADAKSKRRDFSEQAWAVLLVWKEVQASSVDQPICEECYLELRETLIDRAGEIEEALNAPSAPQKGAVVAKGKGRKAG